VAGVKEKPK